MLVLTKGPQRLMLQQRPISWMGTGLRDADGVLKVAATWLQAAQFCRTELMSVSIPYHK